MLAWLPSPILLILNLILIPLNTIIIATPMQLLGLLRLILPVKPVIWVIDKCNYWLYRAWSFDTAVILAVTNNIKWHITGDAIPVVKNSCMVISNHLSWADILMICLIYRGKIPITKFFMKHSLIYIPFVGLACYAIGMPFLRRYPKEKLLKDPALREKDIKTTKAACKRLALSPAALINFVEGTRYTPEKAKIARSPYQNLMPPKAASLGVALGEIGRDIDCIFNTTLCYPRNRFPNKPFIDLLNGRLKDVYCNIEIIKTGPGLEGDYLNDKVYKHDFTMRVRDLWQKKDAVIEGQLEAAGIKKLPLKEETAEKAAENKEAAKEQAPESTSESKD